jgi:hypothetical protein
MLITLTQQKLASEAEVIMGLTDLLWLPLRLILQERVKKS